MEGVDARDKAEKEEEGEDEEEEDGQVDEGEATCRGSPLGHDDGRVAWARMNAAACEGDKAWVEMLEVVARVVRVLGVVLGSCKGRA